MQQRSARMLGFRTGLTALIAVLAGLLLVAAAPSSAQECLDSSRTLLPGGPGNQGCRVYDSDPTNCNASFIVGGSGPTSCYIDEEGDCEGCGPNNEGLDCTNACQPAPVCAGAPGRTLFVGGSGGEACREFNDDVAQCNLAFHRSQNGQFTSCFTTHACDPCGDDDSGFCVNSCVPPPTCLDMTRPNFVGGPGTSACRQFEDDETACNQAFHLGEDGVAPCFYDSDDGQCRGCGLNNEDDGDCVNTCIAPPPCLDMALTYAGGPGTEPCRQFDADQSGCEGAYIRGGNGRATPCYYDAGDDRCRGCGPENEGDGECTNTCTAPVPCADMTRTTYAGPPRSEGCNRYDGDQAGCELAYVEGDAGVASCYYDSGDDNCRGCGPSNENNGECTNTCATTPTCLDMTRTIYTGGPGSEGCRQFEDDETQCLQAFTRGNGGVASCFFEEDGDCRGCGPENVNDGDCVNTCKVQPICGSDPGRTVLGCSTFDGDPTGCAAAYGLLQDGSPTSCVSVDLCLGCGPNNQGDGLCTNACAQVTGVVTAPAVSWRGLLAVVLALTALGFLRLRRRV
jgi:hypothetical protein